MNQLQHNDMNRQYITTPTSLDVISGRGSGIQNHIGNVKFRELVSSRKKEYADAEKFKKLCISKEIVAMVRANGGRFLKESDDTTLTTQLYVDIGDKKAWAKTSQTLRDQPRTDTTPLQHDDCTKKPFQKVDCDVLIDIVSKKRKELDTTTAESVTIKKKKTATSIPLQLYALEDSNASDDGGTNNDNISLDDSPRLIHDMDTRNKEEEEEEVATKQHDIRPIFYQLYEKVLYKLTSAVQVKESEEVVVDFYTYLQKWFDTMSELEGFDPSVVDCTHIQQQLDYFDTITAKLANAKLMEDDARLRMYTSELKMMIVNCKRVISIPTRVVKLEEDQYGMIPTEIVHNTWKAALVHDDGSSKGELVDAEEQQEGARLSSDYIGVSYYKKSKKWQTRLNYNGERQHLGYFSLQVDAALAFDEATKLLSGPTAETNFSSIQDYEKAKKDELAKTILGSSVSMSYEAIKVKVTRIVRKTWTGGYH